MDKSLDEQKPDVSPTQELIARDTLEFIRATTESFSHIDTTDTLVQYTVERLYDFFQASFTAILVVENHPQANNLLITKSHFENDKTKIKYISLNGESVLANAVSENQAIIWGKDTNQPPFNFIHIPRTQVGVVYPWNSGDIKGVFIVLDAGEKHKSVSIYSVLEILAGSLPFFIQKTRIIETPRQSLIDVKASHLEHFGAVWKQTGGINRDYRLGYEYKEETINPLKVKPTDTSPAIQNGEMVIQESKDGSTTFVALPIKLRDQNLGALRIRFKNRDAAEKSIHLIEQISERLALAMENSRLFQEVTDRSEELNLLAQVTSILNASLDLAANLNFIVETLTRVLPIQFVSIQLLDDTKSNFVGIVEHGHSTKPVYDSSEVPAIGNEFLNRIIKTGKTLFIENIESEDIPDNLRKSMNLLKARSLAVLPILVGEEIIGIVTLVVEKEGVTLTRQEIQFGETIINQTATAIQNARLYQRQQKRAIQLQAGAKVSQAASSMFELNELLPTTVEHIREAFNLYYAGIFLIDDTGEWAVLRAGTGEAGRIQLEQNHKLKIGGASMIGQAISMQKARISQDVGGLEIHFRNPHLPDTRSEMALPLISLGQVIGAMTIQSRQESAFSQEDITSLQTMADQIAIAILNATLFERTQRQNLALTTLNEMSRVLSTQLDINTVVETIYKYTSRLMPTSSFFIALYNAEEDLLEFPINIENNIRRTVPPIKKSKGLTQYVIDSKQPLLINEDVEATIERLGLDYLLIGEPSKSWLGVPMLFGNDVVGVITNQDTEKGEAFSVEDLDILASIANQAAIAIQNAHLFWEIQETLVETETLYKASSALNAAQTLSDVIEVFRNFTIFGKNASWISIDLFDKPYTDIYTPQRINVLDSWAKNPDPKLFSAYSFENYPDILKVLKPDQLIIIEELADDPYMDDELIALFNDTFQAKSMIFVPLKIRGEWIGFIHGLFPTRTTINPTEEQGLKTLASQTAVVVQGINQLEFLREKARRDQILAEITSRIYNATDPETILRITAQQVGQALGRKTMIYLDPEE